MAEIILSLKLGLWQYKCSVFCTCYRFEMLWFLTWKIPVTRSEYLLVVIQLKNHSKQGILKNVSSYTLMLQKLMHYIYGQLPHLWRHTFAFCNLSFVSQPMPLCSSPGCFMVHSSMHYPTPSQTPKLPLKPLEVKPRYVFLRIC